METAVTMEALREKLTHLARRGDDPNGTWRLAARLQPEPNRRPGLGDDPNGTWRLAARGNGFRLTKWKWVERMGRSHPVLVISVRSSATARGLRVSVRVRSPLAVILFLVYFAVSAVVGGAAASVCALAQGNLSSFSVCLLFAGVMPAVAWAAVVRPLLPEIRMAENAVRRFLPPALRETGPFR